jgi:hypothetical protein
MKTGLGLRVITLMLAVSAFSMGASETVSAQGREKIEGSARLEMERKCRAGKPRRDEDRELALRMAKVNALAKWIDGKEPAYQELYAAAERQIIDDIDKYVINVDITYEACTGAKRSYEVDIEAEPSIAAIDRVLRSNKPKVVGPRSRMTAVFVARRLASVKAYDDKVTKITENQEFSEAEQSAEVNGESIAASGYSSTRNVTTTGGSTESKSEKRCYDVFQPDFLNTAVNQTFSSYGFRVIDASQVAGRFPDFNLNAMRAEFGSGPDGDCEQPGLSGETKNAAFNAIAGKIPLLVVATLDVGQPGVGPYGNQVVFVRVTAEVFQDDGLFYEAVAAYGPTQYQGKGPTVIVAETNALNLAAEKAATEIVNLLNARGIM